MTIRLTAKDYNLAAFGGFLTGICVIPLLLNSTSHHNNAVLAALPVVLAIAWAVGLWLGKTLAGIWTPIFQLAKFAEVGFLNTAIGFGVINVISILTGVTAGVGAGWINVPGTILAACNSYIWNKTWVFEKVDNKGFFRDALKFAGVTLVAIVINGIIIALFTDKVPAMFGLSAGAWLNVGKVVATAGSFMIDYLGYKFLVFAKKS